MLIPAALDMYDTQSSWSAFLSSSIVALFIGVSLFLANRTPIKRVSLQQGYLLTIASWFSVIFVATFPFVESGVTSSFADAIFETASGISTTGATIFSNVEALPRSILLWRSILSGMGGVGIVIFAIAMLPFLGIGGMQIFQHENSDFNDKLLPKISYLAKRIIFIYALLVILCFLSFHWSGMSWFDAINHALTTVSTCGFSTKNASIGYYNSALIDYITVIFMVLGAIPLTYYYTVIINKNIHSLRTAQVIFFFKLLAVYIGFTALWLVYLGIYDFWDALRYSSFNVVSITTSTGYASTNYMEWGNFAGTVFIIFALTGGCTGSTSGSIKIFRWQVVLAFLKKHIITSIEPNRVVPVKIGNLASDNNLVTSVFVFLSAFSFSIIIFTVFLALNGLDFSTAFSSVVACITNSGPGIGELVGPAGNYSSLSSSIKYALAFVMMLGRLEVLTILVVLSKNFWHQ